MKISMEKISVIVPIYNAEKTLDRCINSLVKQTYKNIEIILVNDGSTDNSRDIIEKYKKKYSNKINVINQLNRGIGAARNVGILNSTGNYLGFVDSDDYVEFDMYEKLYNKIKDSNSDIVVCDYYQFNTKKREQVIVGHNSEFDVSLLENPKLINEIDYAPWNKLYKKNLFKGIEFPLNIKYEDLSTILKVFYKAKKITKLNSALYNYLINENGETQTIDYRNFDSYLIISDIIENFKEQKNNIDFWREVEKLAIDKLYYTITSTFILENSSKSKEFVNNTINLLNNNFKGWKKRNLKKYNLLKRTLMSNKFLYNSWIDFKLKNKKKNLIIFAYSLEIGGIETSLINLLKKIDYKKYNITLFLEKKEGSLLSEVPKFVSIIDYNLTYSNKLITKIKNKIKYYGFIIRMYKKYDFAINYATYRGTLSTFALFMARKNAIWCHGDYTTIYEDKEELFNFMKKIKIRKFDNIVFVSERVKNNLEEVIPEIKNKTQVIYNLIDNKKIEKLANEEISEKKENTLLVYVGRVEEFCKNISMLIKVVSRIKNDNFELWIIGDGVDKKKYEEMVKNLNIENKVKFLGRKNNPYPYLKIADALVLSSVSEGNPMVYIEAMVMKLPILTTNVSDAKKLIDKKYGVVSDIDEDSFYKMLNDFINKKKLSIKEFNAEDYNEKSIEKIYKMINNR